MTQLDTPTQSGPPAAYFPAVGDSMVVGIVDVGEYQQKDYDTGEPLTWPDGGPKKGKVVTGLVMSATGARAGGEGASSDVGAGDLVTFWCEGGKFFTYRDAIKAAGGVNLGDVMLWKRGDDEPPKNTRHKPRKVYTAIIRRPEAKDGDIVERCTKARNDLKAERLDAEPAAAHDPSSDPF